MAGRYLAPPLSVHLSREDQQWLVKLAGREDISVHAVVNEAVRFFRKWHEKGQQALGEVLDAIDCACTEYEEQRQRLHYCQREYRLQSRRMYNMRREYEKQLWHERNLRRAYAERIRRRHYYERLVRPAAEADRNALYGPKVTRLMALAVCSESDGEAAAAFAKARVLYHQKALFLA